MKEIKYKKRYSLWHLLRGHSYTNCIEFGDFGLGGETKIEFSSPWALFGIRYTHYQCQDCGRKFWMPKGNFEEIKMKERFIKSISNTPN